MEINYIWYRHRNSQFHKLKLLCWKWSCGKQIPSCLLYFLSSKCGLTKWIFVDQVFEVFGTPWCRHLEGTHSPSNLLYHINLSCTRPFLCDSVSEQHLENLFHKSGEKHELETIIINMTLFGRFRFWVVLPRAIIRLRPLGW